MSTRGTAEGRSMVDNYTTTERERGYSVRTYADGFGRWHARIDFPHGAGNTGEGERLISNARRAAQRAIRRELIARGELPQHRIAVNADGSSRKFRLRFEVVANREFPSSGALASLTIAER